MQFPDFSGQFPDCRDSQNIQQTYTIALNWLFTNTLLRENEQESDFPEWSGLQPAMSDEFWTVASHLLGNEVESSAADGEDTFNVVVNGDVNLRECAGTQCVVVGQAVNGSLLTVLGTETASDGDWYRVQTVDGIAYIASWLTTRGPDETISVDEPYLDELTGCGVSIITRRGDDDMRVILAESGRNEVLVDLYRPNQSRPVSVDAQYDKTFIDTGEPYIDQVYGFFESWPNGLYQLEISFGGATSRLAWNKEVAGEYVIYVLCVA